MASQKTFVLVSGANQGIGLEIVKKLATENPEYQVLMGCRSLEKGQAAIASLPHNLSVEPIELNITTDSSISKAVATVQEKYGRLDVLINNAGIAQRALSQGLSLRQQYTQIMDTNAISAACLTEAFVPLLQKSSHPRIIFMTSELGSIGSTLDPDFIYYGMDNPQYKASKAAMNMIMATYAVKYKDAGFQVNVCCPGFNATNMNGFNERAGDPRNGAINACRLATAGKDGQTGTFTNKEGPMPW